MVICAVWWPDTQVFAQYSPLRFHKNDEMDEFDAKFVSTVVVRRTPGLYDNNPFYGPICAVWWPDTQIFALYLHLGFHKNEEMDDFDAKFVSSCQVHTWDI